MKKTLCFLLLILISIIILSYDESNNEISQSSNAPIKSIVLNSHFSLYTGDFQDGNSLYFYFRLNPNERFNIENIETAISKVSLIKDGINIFETTSYLGIHIIKGDLFQVSVWVDKSHEFNYSHINQIRFNDDPELTVELGLFTFDYTSDSTIYLYIDGAPLQMFKDQVAPSIFTAPYGLTVWNKTDDVEILAEIKTEQFNHLLSVVDISISFDDYHTERMRTMYEAQHESERVNYTGEEDLSLLNCYRIEVTYSIKDIVNFAFQPAIIVTIDGIEYGLFAQHPMVLLCELGNFVQD